MFPASYLAPRGMRLRIGAPRLGWLTGALLSMACGMIRTCVEVSSEFEGEASRGADLGGAGRRDPAAGGLPEPGQGLLRGPCWCVFLERSKVHDFRQVAHVAISPPDVCS